jgi:hypothetical protein
MSQVAKSASAFVRAFLAILVLELEDMVVRLVRPAKLVDVHGDRSTVHMSGFSTFRKCRNVPTWVRKAPERISTNRSEFMGLHPDLIMLWAVGYSMIETRTAPARGAVSLL